MTRRAALPWTTGRLLDTHQTRLMDEKTRARYEADEKMRVFSRFSAEDEGRSRELVGFFRNEEDAAFVAALTTSALGLARSGFDPDFFGAADPILCVCAHHAWMDPPDYHEPACLAVRSIVRLVAEHAKLTEPVKLTSASTAPASVNKERV